MRKNIIFVTLLLSMISCDKISFIVTDFASTVKVYNQSNHSIYVYHSFEDTLYIHKIIIDGKERICDIPSIESVIINYKGKDTLIYPKEIANPNSTAYIGFSCKIEDIFKTYENDGYLKLFIINMDTMIKYTWEEIVTKQLYERKLIFTEEELKKNNWTITYK